MVASFPLSAPVLANAGAEDEALDTTAALVVAVPVPTPPLVFGADVLTDDDSDGVARVVVGVDTGELGEPTGV